MQRKIIGGEITPKRGRGRPKGPTNKKKAPETEPLATMPERRQAKNTFRTVNPPEKGPLAKNPFGGLKQLTIVVDNSEQLTLDFIASTKQNAQQFAAKDYPGAAKSALVCANIANQLADKEREIFWFGRAITCYKMAGFKKEVGENSSRLADIYAGLKNNKQAAFYYMQAATSLRAYGKYHDAGLNAVKSAEQNKQAGNSQWEFNAYDLAVKCFKDAQDASLEHAARAKRDKARH